MKTKFSAFAVLAALALSALTLSAKELKDIPYYSSDTPKTGNLEYLKERCKLDLYLPDDRKNFPVLVWFHGGSLLFGKKGAPSHINRKEIGIVAVNYRLSGDRAQCPDYIHDAAAAVAWVVKHIRDYGGDPSMIYVSGGSAGGYLATMIAMDPKYLETYGAKPHDVKAWYSISGQMSTHFTVIAERKKKNPDRPVQTLELDEYAPIVAARPGAPELILLVGDAKVDWPGRVEENFLMASVLERLHGNKQIRCYSFPTCSHATVSEPSWVHINTRIMQDLKARNKAAKKK